MLAVALAVLMPLAGEAQLFHRHHNPAAAENAPSAKYDLFAGWSYISLNQVNQSRHGLQGVNVAGTRYFGHTFGLTADLGFYPTSLVNDNPGNPSSDVILAGPMLRTHLFYRFDGFARGLIGVQHTGGETGGKPDLSFAAGYGIGMDYRLKGNFSLRASGDNVLSSYVEDPNHLGYSAHEHANLRGAIGLVYKF